eukprot:m.144227 g.144227  ORF g.144227 m.144227 type:complete len:151 (-) comp15003_c0_seq2:476-928(-)
MSARPSQQWQEYCVGFWQNNGLEARTCVGLSLVVADELEYQNRAEEHFSSPFRFTYLKKAKESPAEPSPTLPEQRPYAHPHEIYSAAALKAIDLLSSANFRQRTAARLSAAVSTQAGFTASVCRRLVSGEALKQAWARSTDRVSASLRRK